MKAAEQKALVEVPSEGGLRWQRFEVGKTLDKAAALRLQASDSEHPVPTRFMQIRRHRNGMSDRT